MIKRIILVSIINTFILGILQAQTVFNKVYDDSLRYESAFGVTTAFNGGYLVSGVTNDLVSFHGILFKRIDLNGNVIWTKIHVTTMLGIDGSKSLIKTNDYSYIVCGTTKDTAGIKTDAYLMKLDSSGNFLWLKRYGGIYNDVGNDVKQTSDGGYVLAGWTTLTANGFEDAYLVKTDSAGNMQWEQHYGGGNTDAIFSVNLTPDGGYVLGGTTFNVYLGNPSTPPNMYMVKTDSLGNLQWQKGYGGSGYDIGERATTTLDGGYLLVGGLETPIGSGLNNGYIIKTDNQGTEQWSKTFGVNNVNDLFVSARQSADSNFWVSGTKGYGQFDGWLVKLKPNGDTSFTKNYRYYPDTNLTYHPEHYFYNMDLTNDGGAIMCGMTINNLVQEKNDFWVVKVDSLGCSDTSCMITTNLHEFPVSGIQLSVFPNPVKNVLTLRFQRMPFTLASIHIYNMLGQNLLAKKEFVRDFVSVDVSSLSSGIYAVMVEYEGMKEVMKFVKE
jgi:hypothetical protein